MQYLIGFIGGVAAVALTAMLIEMVSAFVIEPRKRKQRQQRWTADDQAVLEGINDPY